MTHKLNILFVRTWTLDSARIRSSLRAHGLSALITRIDFPAALHAALLRTTFDLVIYDPTTNSISHDVLASCLREHDQNAPVIILEDDDVGAIAAAKLQQGRS